MASSMHLVLSLLFLALEITFVFGVVTKCFEPDPTKAKFNYVPLSCLCKFSGFISFFFYTKKLRIFKLFDKYLLYLHCLFKKDVKLKYLSILLSKYINLTLK